MRNFHISSCFGSLPDQDANYLEEDVLASSASYAIIKFCHRHPKFEFWSIVVAELH